MWIKSIIDKLRYPFVNKTIQQYIQKGVSGTEQDEKDIGHCWTRDVRLLLCNKTNFLIYILTSFLSFCLYCLWSRKTMTMMVFNSFFFSYYIVLTTMVYLKIFHFCKWLYEPYYEISSKKNNGLHFLFRASQRKKKKEYQPSRFLLKERDMSRNKIEI